MHHVRLGAEAHQKVVGLDVPVHEVALVDDLHLSHQLIYDHESCFQTKFAAAKFLEIIKTGSEKLHGDIVYAFVMAKTVYLGEAILPRTIIDMVLEVLLTRLYSLDHERYVCLIHQEWEICA